MTLTPTQVLLILAVIGLLIMLASPKNTIREAVGGILMLGSALAIPVMAVMW